MKELLGLAVLAWPLTLSVLILLAFVAAISIATRYAKRTGRSKWRWGAVGFLVVYLPIFWDWIPTMVAHQYYCSTEAGFWVYKTVDQWKKENPGVMETLVRNKGAPSAHGAYLLNQRFNWVVKKEGPFLFNRWRWEQELVDTKTGNALARYVDFSTGNGFIGGPEAPLKFWLQSGHCHGGDRNDSLMWHFVENFLGVKK